MYFNDLTGTCPLVLRQRNCATVLLEEALMESDQHVFKAAFLVEIEAVGSCCIFLGTWMLYPEPDTVVIETTWVLLWILEHGNLSGWRVVASGWKLVVSGIWRWSPWNLGLVENVGWSITRRHSCILLHPGFTFCLENVNDGLSPSGFWKAQPFGGYLVIRTLSSERSRQLISFLQSIFIKTLGEFLVCLCTSSFCSCEGAGSVMLVLEKAFSSLFFSCSVILLYFSIRLDQVGVSRHGARDNSSMRIS